MLDSPLEVPGAAAERGPSALQVLYNAQMIRTWSLLLRNAQRSGYIVSGRQVSATAGQTLHVVTLLNFLTRRIPQTCYMLPCPGCAAVE